MYLTDIYITFHPITVEYRFFSSIVHGSFPRIDHMLAHKTSLNTFSKIGITSSVFSDHNRIKLQINNKRNIINCISLCKLNNILLNKKKKWVNEKSKI